MTKRERKGRERSGHAPHYWDAVEWRGVGGRFVAVLDEASDLPARLYEQAQAFLEEQSRRNQARGQ